MKITKQESEVLRLRRRGLSLGTIGRCLNISEPTVQRYVTRLRRAGYRLPIYRRGSTPISYVEEMCSVQGLVLGLPTTVYSVDPAHAQAELTRLQGGV